VLLKALVERGVHDVGGVRLEVVGQRGIDDLVHRRVRDQRIVAQRLGESTGS